MAHTLPAPRTIALTLAFVLLAALVVIAELAQSGLNHIGTRIDRSQQRQILLARVLHDLSASQAAQRAYLLSADARQLTLYRTAGARVAPSLRNLTGLAQRDAPLLAAQESAALARLRELAHTELQALQSSLMLYEREGTQQAMPLIRADLGQPTMSDISDQAAVISEAEHRLVEMQLAAARRLRTLSRALMEAVAALNATLLIIAAVLLARQARRRAARAAQLARSNEELEGRVRRRTAELSALSSHLQQLSEREKATLARELHDELGGLLIAVKMDASWLRKRWASPAADIEARWARVFKALDDGVDFKRRIVENLRPTLLDNMGLLPAVRWITQECCSRAGLQYTEIYPEQEPQLTEEASIMVFRLVQESLTNVVKHAHATHVRVQVALQGEQLLVLIEDNGTGIDPGRRDAVGSHGLAIMRHRVRSCWGTLEIDSAAHGGTRVRALLPLARILRPPLPSAASAQGLQTQPAPAGGSGAGGTGSGGSGVQQPRPARAHGAAGAGT
jgi:signal transduction histidine kinase